MSTAVATAAPDPEPNRLKGYATVARRVRLASITESPLLDRRRPLAVIEEMVDSIREKGLLCPPILRDMGNGTYRIVAGATRIAALRYLGEEEVDAKVVLGDLSEAAEKALTFTENEKRSGWTARERHEIIVSFVVKDGLSQIEVAQKLGIAHSEVCKACKIDARLLPELRDRVFDGTLPTSNAYQLSALPPDVQRELLATAHTLTRSQITDLVVRHGRKTPPPEYVEIDVGFGITIRAPLDKLEVLRQVGKHLPKSLDWIKDGGQPPAALSEYFKQHFRPQP